MLFRSEQPETVGQRGQRAVGLLDLRDDRREVGVHRGTSVADRLQGATRADHVVFAVGEVAFERGEPCRPVGCGADRDGSDEQAVSRHEGGAGRVGGAAHGGGEVVHEVDVPEEDADDAARWAVGLDLIYVGGGNTACLLDRWRNTGQSEGLLDAARTGALIVGTSAGAVCWFDFALSDSSGDRKSTRLNSSH